MASIKIEDVRQDGLTKDNEYIHYNGIYNYEFTINMTPDIKNCVNHEIPVVSLTYDIYKAQPNNIDRCEQFIKFSDMYERKFNDDFFITFAFLHMFPQEFKIHINNNEIMLVPNDFDELINYLREITLDSQITYKFKLTDKHKHKSSVKSYIPEVYEIRINPIISRFMDIHYLKRLVVECNQTFTCDICYNEDIIDDYKYMPLCCRNFDRSICQECAQYEYLMIIFSIIYCNEENDCKFMGKFYPIENNCLKLNNKTCLEIRPNDSVLVHNKLMYININGVLYHNFTSNAKKCELFNIFLRIIKDNKFTNKRFILNNKCGNMGNKKVNYEILIDYNVITFVIANKEDLDISSNITLNKTSIPIQVLAQDLINKYPELKSLYKETDVLYENTIDIINSIDYRITINHNNIKLSFFKGKYSIDIYDIPDYKKIFDEVSLHIPSFAKKDFHDISYLEISQERFLQFHELLKHYTDIDIIVNIDKECNIKFMRFE